MAPGLVGRALTFALLRGAASGLSLLSLDRPKPRVQVQAGLQAFAETPELGAQSVESGIYPIEPGIGPVALPDQHDDCQKDRNYDRRNCRYALYAHNRHRPWDYAEVRFDFTRILRGSAGEPHEDRHAPIISCANGHEISTPSARWRGWSGLSSAPSGP